jgi:dihydroneopterin aldolase
MPGRDLTAIKLGGSHAFEAHLKDWIDAIAACRTPIVVVPGGGPFADAVRDAQPKMRFDDAAAHRMALLGMEQYACALASLDRRFVPADSRAAIERALKAGKVPIWLPARMVLGAPEIPWSWDVTSDSLAAWLAGRLKAARLLLIKHVDPGTSHAAALDLAARGIVDPAFPAFLQASGVPAFILDAAGHSEMGQALRAGRAPGTPIDACPPRTDGLS